MDTKEFVKEGKKTAAGIRAQKKVFESVITPAEKYKLELKKLKKLQKSGLVTGEAYRRKLAQIESQYRKTGRRAGMLGKAFGGLSGKMTAFLGAFTAGAAIRGINRTIDRMDELSKRARSLGTSTEFLSRLQFAAGVESGLSDEQTSKAIEKMTRRISEAAVGTGEAQNAIKELGLDAKALAASGPEKAIEQIAAAMQSVSNEGDVLRISTKLFDDEQARLGLTLKQTNAQLEEQFKLADQLGKTLSSSDALDAEAAAQAISNVGTAIGGVAMAITSELLPAIKGITNGLNKVPGFLSGAGKGFETISRTLQNDSGMLFSNPLREFQMNAIGTETDRNRQSRAAVNDAAATARLAAMEKADAEQKALEEKKAEEQRKLSEAMTGFVTNFKMPTLADLKDQDPFAFAGGAPVGPAAKAIVKTSDPMASVTAGSSEAFKIANRIKAGKTVEQQAATETATNTANSAKWLEGIAAEITNAIPVGL